MNFEHDRRQDAAGEPSLAEMTGKAIDILARNPEGYLLLVEGDASITVATTVTPTAR